MIRRLIDDLITLFKGAYEIIRLFNTTTPEERAVFMKLAQKKETAEDDSEARFLAAKNKADAMTLEELVEISEDFNVGYDIPESMFEIMVKIPMERLEAGEW